MEILTRLGGLLSPSFFVILAGLSLTAAVLLFIAGKSNATRLQVTSTKISNLEPIEYRSAGYLVLAFGWSIVGLVLGFVFAALGTSFSGSLILVILSLLCLLLTLCFLYAGGGTLLHAVTGQKGETIYWFFPFMEPVDSLIVRFGDLLTSRLPRQLWSPRTVTETGLAKETKETHVPVVAGFVETEATREMERLQHKITQYEARLTLEQREKFMKARRIMEELRNMYP